MAKETTTRLVDDLDGSTADVTVTFTVEGVAYEIDLSARNAEAFRAALSPFVAAARRARQTGRSAARPTSAQRPARGRPVDLAAVREWALREGRSVAGRGRVAQSVIDAFHAAHAAQQALTHQVSAAQNHPSEPATAVAARPAPARKATSTATAPTRGRARTAPAKTRARRAATAPDAGSTATGIGAAAATPPPPAASVDGPSLEELRAWATEQGMPVAGRGRVSQAVRQAYLAARVPTADADTPSVDASVAPIKTAKARPPRTSRTPKKSTRSPATPEQASTM